MITRLVGLSAVFFPEAGVTDYPVLFGFDPIDPVTRMPIPDPATGLASVGRRVGAPAGAESTLDDGRLGYRFSTCLLTGSYDVKIYIVRPGVTPTSYLFQESCDGDLAAVTGAIVRYSQASATDPLVAEHCLEVP